eukprot:NODE_5066_length_533_cov_308.082645_g3735_i0.p4 GENE.NODE_5066_length_533_cov_308.082645_g3735_i0~~NODE_5066_length_533_cov_308.082645_g3735_i0.p4  ORF type:complete len:71 (+),score=9.68 NODE_5066_length_533_cov_308.082645_g3735_i0:203-415(+)
MEWPAACPRLRCVDDPACTCRMHLLLRVDTLCCCFSSDSSFLWVTHTSSQRSYQCRQSNDNYGCTHQIVS